MIHSLDLLIVNLGSAEPPSATMLLLYFPIFLGRMLSPSGPTGNQGVNATCCGFESFGSAGRSESMEQFGRRGGNRAFASHVADGTKPISRSEIRYLEPSRFRLMMKDMRSDRPTLCSTADIPPLLPRLFETEVHMSRRHLRLPAVPTSNCHCRALYRRRSCFHPHYDRSFRREGRLKYLSVTQVPCHIELQRIVANFARETSVVWKARVAPLTASRVSFIMVVVVESQQRLYRR